MDYKNQKYDIFNMFEKRNALVTAGNSESFNGCTIGWGSLGTVWGRPMATVYVNPARYTSEFLLREDYFTVSFFGDDHREDLNIMGTKSGRDCDKISLTKLTPVADENKVVYKEAELTFVCKKVYWGLFEGEHFDQSLNDRFYIPRQLPPHYEFIGEIVDVIEK